MAFPLGQKSEKKNPDKTYAPVSAAAEFQGLGKASEQGVVYTTVFLFGFLMLTGLVVLILPLFLV